MDYFNMYLGYTNLNLIKDVCLRTGILKVYARKEHFVKAGDANSYVGYVKRGTFRYTCFNPAEEKEYNTGFAFEKEFVADYPACLYPVVSEISIQAITPCEVYVCDIQEILRTFNADSGGLLQARITAEQILFCVYRNYIDLYRKTAEERYVEILDRCPEILQIITLKELSSYLKITPITMSKIRRKITFGE